MLTLIDWWHQDQKLYSIHECTTSETAKSAVHLDVQLYLSVGLVLMGSEHNAQFLSLSSSQSTTRHFQAPNAQPNIPQPPKLLMRISQLPKLQAVPSFPNSKQFPASQAPSSSQLPKFQAVPSFPSSKQFPASQAPSSSQLPKLQAVPSFPSSKQFPASQAPSSSQLPKLQAVPSFRL